ncbi:SRPBCC family protein [Sphingomonas colocasiae]|uniref:SRPBCC family protein n=1 Tax=Sphingomonas colocasiae TaxID=1848973 RepID=A0ABS7PV35_9SPHN|nr:SRPBCC family protein [Sphingomonas colocasiae]MBY8825221.1 SRPBCC family protein [Sphingomonas colocasiae]
MTTDPVAHHSFVIERELPGPPRQAFRFWSDPKLKDRWSGCHADWTILEDAFDFRPGGLEIKRWRTPEGEELTFHGHYLDIVPRERIIYAYEMSFGGVRLSASLVTIELTPQGDRTRMKFTEQAAFLTGDDASEQRRQGTQEGVDRLVDAIAADMPDAA